MVAAFKRMRFREARNLLDKLCIRYDGKEASTNKSSTKEQRSEADEPSWWVENDDLVPSHDSPRSKSYLRAYVEIGGPVFYATGIPLLDGYLQPDRAVMKAMLLKGCVTLSEGRNKMFELTQKGWDLISETSAD